MISPLACLRYTICLFLAVFSLQLPAAQDRLLIYRIKTPGAEMHILGSMHLARADIYPLRQQILDAFEAADSLVVEVDITGERELMIQQQMMLRGTYPPAENLRNHVSAQTWRELERQLPKSGLPMAAAERMKPGLVATLLTVQHMMALGLNPEQGVDRFFLDRARGSKRILELETVEQQIDLLVDFPDADLFLRQTLYQLDHLPELLNPMVESWRRGDSAALEKLVFSDELARYPEFSPVLERLFDSRNRAMAGKLVQYLQRGGRYFVVVGAGHLVGTQGIIALLEKQAYKVSQQ
jgi:uncharacterized protein YbaP (TraB family)